MKETAHKSTTPAHQRAPVPATTTEQVNALAQSPRVVMQRKTIGERFGGASPPVAGGAGGGGLPPSLTRGIAALSGFDLSDVNVHENSSMPARFGASALAQGNDIHLGPGQNRYLPHEAWHVVQQRQGRVSADVQAKGGPLNTDPKLEREADIKGAEAALVGNSMSPAFIAADLGRSSALSNSGVIQLGGDKKGGQRTGSVGKQQKPLSAEVIGLRAECEVRCSEFGRVMNRFSLAFTPRERDPYDDHYGRHYVTFADHIIAPIAKEQILPLLARKVYTKAQKTAQEVDASVMDNFRKRADGEVQRFVDDNKGSKGASTPVEQWRDVRAQYVAKKLKKVDAKNKKSEKVARIAVEELNRQIVLEDLASDTEKIVEWLNELVVAKKKESPNGRLAKTLKLAQAPLDDLQNKTFDRYWASEEETDPDKLKQYAAEIQANTGAFEQIAENNVGEVQSFIVEALKGDTWGWFTTMKSQTKQFRKSPSSVDAILEKMRKAQKDADAVENAIQHAAATVFDQSLTTCAESWGRAIDKELKEVGTSVTIALKHKLSLAWAGAPGAYLSVSFKGKASRDEKGVTCAFTGSVAAGVGIKGLFDLNVSLGGYVKGKGKNAAQALDLMFYALYKRALRRDLPGACLDAVWGRRGIPGSHAIWAAAVESQMEKGHSAESGAKVDFAAGIGGKLLGADVGIGYSTGTKYALEKEPDTDKDKKKDGKPKDKKDKQKQKHGKNPALKNIVASESNSFSIETSVHCGPLSGALGISVSTSKPQLNKGESKSKDKSKKSAGETTVSGSVTVECGNRELASSSALIKAIFARALEYAHRRLTIYYDRKNKTESLNAGQVSPEKKLLNALQKEATSFATGAGKQEAFRQVDEYRGKAPKTQEKPLPMYLDKNADLSTLQQHGYHQTQVQVGQKAHQQLQPVMDNANQFNHTMKQGLSPQLDNALTTYKAKGSTSVELSFKYKSDISGQKLTFELTLTDQAPKTLEALRAFKFLKVMAAKNTTLASLEVSL